MPKLTIDHKGFQSCIDLLPYDPNQKDVLSPLAPLTITKQTGIENGKATYTKISGITELEVKNGSSLAVKLHDPLASIVVKKDSKLHVNNEFLSYSPTKTNISIEENSRLDIASSMKLGNVTIYPNASLNFTYKPYGYFIYTDSTKNPITIPDAKQVIDLHTKWRQEQFSYKNLTKDEAKFYKENSQAFQLIKKLVNKNITECNLVNHDKLTKVIQEKFSKIDEEPDNSLVDSIIEPASTLFNEDQTKGKQEYTYEPPTSAVNTQEQEYEVEAIGEIKQV